MGRQFTENESMVLDSIILNRRSVRSFKKDPLSKEIITPILNAGLWAPFAGLAVSLNDEFRKFYVIPGGSEILVRINDTIKEFSKGMLVQFEKQMKENPFIQEKGHNFHMRLTGMVNGGAIGLLEAPCLIIVAEKKGMPPAEK